MKLNKLPEGLPPQTQAKFESDCIGCGNEIGQGDYIYLIDGEWVCEDCKQEAVNV